MTVEEKDDAIEKFCNSRSSCTVNSERCPLWECECGEKSRREIEKEYELLVEGGYLATEKEELEETPIETDNVNHPSHYTQGGMECIDEMVLIFGIPATMDFCLLNAWKYRKRAPFKGKAIEDMAKSDWYLAKYKELEERLNGR